MPSSPGILRRGGKCDKTRRRSTEDRRLDREAARIVATLDRERPVLVAGPTASGKSALALAIAERLGGRIVNADAIQVYADWRVLTARPTPEDEVRAAHALYGHVGGGAVYSVGHWLREVRPLLDAEAPPVIVGGTGLYFAALTGGLAAVPPVPAAIVAEAAARDPGALLAGLDPATAARIDRRNPARIRRAWQVLRATGRGLAAWQDDTPPPALPLYRAQPILLRMDRDALAVRIATRVDAMLAGGALDEARAALGHAPDRPSMKAIGAAELTAHLRGEIGLDEARAAMVVATRRYAKRQRTWFRARMDAWRQLTPGQHS